jgi:cellulose synthase/poly-beta-1,6-N-acetylglucosamine synthase-like glycosyltransferase
VVYLEYKKTSIARRLFVVALFFVLCSTSMIFSIYLLLHSFGALYYFIAISFAILSLITCIFNTVTAYAYYKSYFYDAYFEKLEKSLKPIKEYPTVAVIVPTYKEDVDLIERGMSNLKNLKYEKSKLRYYLHDDSHDPEVNAKKKLLCKKYGFSYVSRPENTNFKAGAINNVLTHSSEEYVAIFDADERLVDTNFLLDLLPYFNDENVSFVQTEKSYEKTNSLFAESVNLFDALFFRFMQPSRALHGTAVFAGSCGIVRRSALDAVGGFPKFVTEDAFFSFESDMHGFKSVYVPRVYALGQPLTFSELVNQQWRYNYGDTQFLLYFLGRMKKANKKDSSIFSRIDYLAYGFGLNYLSSVLILFTLLAIITVVSAAPFAYASFTMLIDAPQGIFYLELLGIAAFGLSILVPVVLTKAYFNSISEGLMLFVLNFALAFARLKGALAALAGSLPGKGWFKGSELKKGPAKFLSTLKVSGIELAFSLIVLLSSAFAMLASNLTGFLWLLWYGALYSSTFFFYYKYG